MPTTPRPAGRTATRASSPPVVVALHPGREGAAAPGVQQLLPLQWSTGDAATAPARGRYRVVRSHGPHHQPAQTSPVPRDGRPEPGTWAGGLVQLVLEVLNGDRPVHQLMRWLDLPVYQDLATARGRAGTQVGATTVRSVHLCELSDRVVEATVMVSGQGRARATAVRLEAAADRWCCTRLAFL